jgi:predicted transcriptional regulator
MMSVIHGGPCTNGKLTIPTVIALRRSTRDWTFSSLLAGVDGGLTQAEISKRLERSPNEFYRMLDRLVRRGYVTRIDGDRYSLTLKLFGLAQLHAPVRRLASYATPLMRELAEQFRQANQLAVFDRGFSRGHRAARSPGILGDLHPRRLSYQPVRHRIGPCPARLPFSEEERQMMISEHVKSRSRSRAV